MNRSQLAFLVLVNALVSLVVALGVMLAFEMRRPDPEELAAINTPRVEPILAQSGEPQFDAPASGVQSPAAGSESGGEQPLPPAETETDHGEAGGNGADEIQDEEYVVQAGDSLFVIATRYNITIDDIVRANNLANPDSIFSGQRLTIPLQGRQAAAQSQESSTPLGEGVEIASIENPGNLAAEYVVIVNESNLAFSLLGWQLGREGGPTYTFGNVPLFPGSSVRLHTRTGDDSSLDFYWDLGDALWQGNGVARLINSQGVEIHRASAP